MIEFLLYLLAILTFLVVFFYIYLCYKLNYWKKRGISGPKPHILYGNFPSSGKGDKCITDDIEFIYNNFKGKEKFAGIFVAKNPQLFLIDPELIKDVYIRKFKSFHDNETGDCFELDPIFGQNPFFLTGDKWKNKRAEITPALTATRLKSMYPIMMNVAKKLSNYIENCSENKPKDGLDTLDVSTRFTVENVGNCSYGIDTGAFSDSECLLKKYTTIIGDNFIQILKNHFLITSFPILRPFFSMNMLPKDAELFFTKLMEDAVQLRKSSGIKRTDFLNFLIELQERKNLTNLEVIGQAMVLYIDGVLTSANVLSHCLHMIARHKPEQERLRNEIREALELEDPISFEKINELQFLDQCIDESLRLFPPGPMLSKYCTEDTEFINSKDKVVKIKKGDVMVIPIFALHHDGEYYPDPYKFNPARFDLENGGIRKYKEMGVFLPFGEGPRQCLGMRFANTQLKCAIVEIVNNFELELNPKMKDEFVLESQGFFIMLKGGIWINFKKI